MRFRAMLLVLVAFSLLASRAFAQKNATVFSNIDQQTGWQSCSTCAGGQNSTTNFSGPNIVSSPSLDGASAQFSINDPTPSYSNVLWWKQELMGASDAAVISSFQNFRYDLYFYIMHPEFSQGLEFDVNQTISNAAKTASTRYPFATECSLKNTGTWRVWSGSAWVDTGIICSAPANTWVHLIWEFQRTNNNQVRFITLTVNGQKHYVNKKYNPTPINVPADDLNTAFQMDGDEAGDPYSTWLDKITLTAW